MPSSDLSLVLELLAHQRGQELGSIAERRKVYDRAESAFADDMPARVENIVAGGVSAEWIPIGADEGSGVVLYLHGGGYSLGSPRSHRHLAAALGRAASAPALVPAIRNEPKRLHNNVRIAT